MSIAKYHKPLIAKLKILFMTIEFFKLTHTSNY